MASCTPSLFLSFIISTGYQLCPGGFVLSGKFQFVLYPVCPRIYPHSFQVIVDCLWTESVFWQGSCKNFGEALIFPPDFPQPRRNTRRRGAVSENWANRLFKHVQATGTQATSLQFAFAAGFWFVGFWLPNPIKPAEGHSGQSTSALVSYGCQGCLSCTNGSKPWSVGLQDF